MVSPKERIILARYTKAQAELESVLKDVEGYYLAAVKDLLARDDSKGAWELAKRIPDEVIRAFAWDAIRQHSINKDQLRLPKC